MHFIWYIFNKEGCSYFCMLFVLFFSSVHLFMFVPLSPCIVTGEPCEKPIWIKCYCICLCLSVNERDEGNYASVCVILSVKVYLPPTPPPWSESSVRYVSRKWKVRNEMRSHFKLIFRLKTHAPLSDTVRRVAHSLGCFFFLCPFINAPMVVFLTVFVIKIRDVGSVL